MARVIRSYGKRAMADQLDVTALAQLADLRQLLDAQTGEVCRALQAQGYSWAQIGAELGMDRSNAAKRYGRARVTGR